MSFVAAKINGAFMNRTLLKTFKDTDIMQRTGGGLMIASR